MSGRPLRPATICVQAPQPPSGGWPVGVVPPIFQSTTYELGAEAYADIEATGGANTWWYTRLANPTVAATAAKVAALEGAEDALLFSSGMAAVTTTLLALVPPGGRVLAARELYGDVYTLLTQELPRHGRSARFVAIDDHTGWRSALADGADLVYLETLSNPMLRVADLPGISALAREAGVLTVCDATFTPPSQLRALDHGVDISIHSATKFLNGHSDLLAGTVSGRAELIDVVRAQANIFGGCLDPRLAAILERGLRTLVVRSERQLATASLLASWLSEHPAVEHVAHPSLPDHPDRALAETLLSGGAALVTFRVTGGDARALAVLGALRIVHQATSLGGVETLASAPFNTSHLGLSAQERAEVGILAGTIRLSVGIEDVKDLTDDLAAALSAPE